MTDSNHVTEADTAFEETEAKPTATLESKTEGKPAAKQSAKATKQAKEKSRSTAKEAQPPNEAPKEEAADSAPKNNPPPVAPAPASPHHSWVLSSSGGQPLSREELLARYRRQRALPEDPFENGARPAPPPGYRDRIMSQPRPVTRFVERVEPSPAEETPPAPVARRSFSLGQTIAIAAFMAIATGGGVTAMNAYLALPGVEAPAQQGERIAPVAEAAAPTAVQKLQPVQEAAAQTTTTVAKKPISTATLEVADVSGQTNSFIPLALHAEGAGLNDDIMLKISGVPENAYLTSGRKDNDQIWSLTLADLKDVKLVVPTAEQPQIDLAVAAFEPKTGELAAPVKTMTVALSNVVVQPVSAPPPDQTESAAPALEQKSALPGASQNALPAAIPPPKNIAVALQTPENSDPQQLLTEGEALLKSGDVREARKIYEKAWSSDSSADAAFGLAQSYDPVVLTGLALKNAKPDKAKALSWYQKAASAGNGEAAAAIVRLQLKP